MTVGRFTIIMPNVLYFYLRVMNTSVWFESGIILAQIVFNRSGFTPGHTLKTLFLWLFMALKSNKLGAQMIVCVLDTLIPPIYSRPSRTLHSFCQ